MRLQVGTARLAYPLAVGRTPRARPTRPAHTPTILATGDSTMQGVDAFLGERLGRSADVISRIRPGTGISKSGGTSCAAAWEDEYSRRARIMMRTWSRFGGRCCG